MLNDDFNGYPIHLVESVDELVRISTTFSPYIYVGVDTETKGLEFKPEQIVGVCSSGGTDYSKDNYHGYYIPIRHENYDNNLPVEVVMNFAQDLLDKYKTVFFNRNFDASMLEYDGVKIPFVGGMHEAQIMAYLTWNEKPQFVKLKPYTEKLLKWKVIEFSEITGGNHNFGQSDPRVSFRYAAGDPLCTVFLARELWQRFPYIRKIYGLDNLATEAVRRMSQQEFHLDFDWLRRELQKTEDKAKALQEQIYVMSGVRGFNLNSPKAKYDVLSRFVTLTKKTDKGGFAMDEDTLREINHPITTLFADYLSTDAHAKHLKTLLSAKPPLHGNYNMTRVASGRLSSSASKGNPYYAPLNMQNIPKKEEKLYMHRHPFLGYCLTREQDGCVVDKNGEPIKHKTKTGLHEVFITRNSDWVWLTADYAAQEMKLAANFSHEPTLLEPLLTGKDIHTYTSEKMFGYNDPNNRTNVKIMNFQCLYGAEKYTIANFLKVALDVAENLLNKYKATMSTLYRWKAAVIAEAKRTGLSFTYFGRPVYVHQYFTASSFSLRSYAERLAVNAKIQGCLPIGTFVRLHDSDNFVCTYHRNMGHAVKYDIDRMGIPTNRGVDDMFMLITKSGDFCVVSSQHKLLLKDRQHLAGLREFSEGPLKVCLSGMYGKKRLLRAALYLLFHPFSTPSLGRIHAESRDTVSLHEIQYYAGFLKSWLLRRHIEMKPLHAHKLRSLADFFGWNLVVTKQNGFKLKFGRKHESTVVASTYCGTDTAVSPSMLTGYQVYSLMGFIHKNTGGDLIRMDCVKFERLRDKDPKWRDNTSFQLTVHDEVNFEVHRTYLHDAWRHTINIMNYTDKNMTVPITVDAGVGTHWGNCLDFVCVSLDNRIVPKDLTPDMLDGDERDYLLDILRNCRKQELPKNLQEYTEIE